MVKNVLTAGILGAVVMIVWMVLVNGIFGFQARLNMKQVKDERVVYETLKSHIDAPGRYVCNPPLDADRRFPEGEPVFSILYGGVGHEAAGKLMLMELCIVLLGPLVAAWLLSNASHRVLSSYVRKVLFFGSIGLLIALFGDLTGTGIGDYPLKDAGLLGLHHLLLWTVAGLVMAWRVKPLS